MKIKIGCSLLIGCLVSSIAVFGQYKPSWRTIPAVIYSGDTISVVYDPVAGGYGDSLPVTGYAYVYRNFEWTGYDFPMKKTDTGYVGPFVIPEGTAAVAWRYWVGDSIDNGRRFPNFAVVHDGKTRQMAGGAYTEYGLVRRRTANGRISPLVREEALVEPRVLTIYLPKEWPNMEVRRRRFPEMARGLRDAYGPRMDSILRIGAAEVAALPDVNEKDLLTLRSLYDNVLGDRKAADSMKAVAMQKYPNGLAVRLNDIWNLYLTRSDSARQLAWDKFNQQWPAAKYPYTDYMDENSGDPRFFYTALRNVANMFYMQRNWKAMNELMSVCPYSMLEDNYIHFIEYALRLDEPPVPMKELYTLANAIVDTIAARTPAADRYRSGRGLFAPDEWERIRLKQQADMFIFHAGLLAKQGKYKEALALTELVRPYASVHDINFNSTYTSALVKEKRDAVPYIQQAIYANAYTPEMVEVLRKQYKGKDFPGYVTSLRNKADIEKEHEQIKASMINLPVNSFTLQDTKGQEVSLARQKGKIVVIDFWATWCYYCKLAMPGMQMAVDKYRDDKNVDFYFIATMEQNPKYKQMIASFLKEKKYEFHVLYDNTNATTGKMDVTYASMAPLVKASGIPLKVVIDQEGRIRWTSTGGNANHIALAEELSYVIELLKKEKFH